MLPMASWSLFDQKPRRHGLRSFQRIANTLSTEAPTDFGVNFEVAVENRYDPQETGVCVEFYGSQSSIDHFLITLMKAPVYKAYSR
ncbi:hypothetical protein EMIT0P291_90123 [Pseudomonas sp. IT-P291]